VRHATGVIAEPRAHWQAQRIMIMIKLRHHCGSPPIPTYIAFIYIKGLSWSYHFLSSLSTKPNTVTLQRSENCPLSPLFPLLSIGMLATASYNNQTPADEYYCAPSPTISLNPTLVNDAHYTERPLLKLSFSCGASNILDSAVINAAGQSLYSISSNSKRTTIILCRDDVEVATVQWDSHGPRMVFRRKKMKCREWLKLAGPDNEHIPVSHSP